MSTKWKKFYEPKLKNTKWLWCYPIHIWHIGYCALRMLLMLPDDFIITTFWPLALHQALISQVEVEGPIGAVLSDITSWSRSVTNSRRLVVQLNWTFLLQINMLTTLQHSLILSFYAQPPFTHNAPDCHENYVLNVHNPIQLNDSDCNP